MVSKKDGAVLAQTEVLSRLVTLIAGKTQMEVIESAITSFFNVAS
jgi:hypothetical protein